jgi:hypothetical protein
MRWFLKDASRAQRIHGTIFVGLLCLALVAAISKAGGTFITTLDNKTTLLLSACVGIVWFLFFARKVPGLRLRMYLFLPPGLAVIAFVNIWLTIPMIVTAVAGNLYQRTYTVSYVSTGGYRRFVCAHYIQLQEYDGLLGNRVCVPRSKWADLAVGTKILAAGNESSLGVYVRIVRSWQSGQADKEPGG